MTLGMIILTIAILCVYIPLLYKSIIGIKKMFNDKRLTSTDEMSMLIACIMTIVILAIIIEQTWDTNLNALL